MTNVIDKTRYQLLEQNPAWIAAVTFGLIAIFASFADRRRVRRSNPDAVGWVPWPLVLIISMLMAAIMIAIALGVLGGN